MLANRVPQSTLVLSHDKRFLVVSPSTANLEKDIPLPSQANLSQYSAKRHHSLFFSSRLVTIVSLYVLFPHAQYFNLRKGAVGTYGYEWSDQDGPAGNESERCLELNVTKYNDGMIDPTNKTFTVDGNTIRSKKDCQGFPPYHTSTHCPN